MAALTLGPRSLTPRVFALDFVSCEKPPQGSWKCQLDQTRRYLWTPPVR